jgi:hypothetical protein
MGNSVCAGCQPDIHAAGDVEGDPDAPQFFNLLAEPGAQALCFRIARIGPALA